MYLHKCVGVYIYTHTFQFVLTTVSYLFDFVWGKVAFGTEDQDHSFEYFSFKFPKLQPLKSKFLA